MTKKFRRFFPILVPIDGSTGSFKYYVIILNTNRMKGPAWNIDSITHTSDESEKGIVQETNMIRWEISEDEFFTKCNAHLAKQGMQMKKEYLKNDLIDELDETFRAEGE